MEHKTLYSLRLHPHNIPQSIYTATKQQPITTTAVHVQMRNRDCTLIGGEDLDNRFLSSHKGKGKTEEEKERGTSQPLIHQKKDKLELCIISLILYLKSHHKWTS